jgi:uncharacterized protein (TIGR02271 family)
MVPASDQHAQRPAEQQPGRGGEGMPHERDPRDEEMQSGAYREGRLPAGEWDRHEGTERLELREEELRARTVPVQAGEVHIGKEIVTEERTLEIPVAREEVVIERHPVEDHRPASGELGEGEEIRVPLMEEHVTIEKHPVVAEEIEIGKRTVEETARVTGTVRREEAHIEHQRNVEVHGVTPETADQEPRRERP